MKKEILIKQELNVDFLQNLAGLFKIGIDYFLQEQNNQMKVMFDEYLSNKEKVDEYLKINQVCEILGIERQTLNNWKKAGVLVPDRFIGRSPLYLDSKILKLKHEKYVG